MTLRPLKAPLWGRRSRPPVRVHVCEDRAAMDAVLYAYADQWVRAYVKPSNVNATLAQAGYSPEGW